MPNCSIDLRPHNSHLDEYRWATFLRKNSTKTVLHFRLFFGKEKKNYILSYPFFVSFYFSLSYLSVDLTKY